MKALGTNIIVEHLKEPEKRGGILLPDVVLRPATRTVKAKVLSIGEKSCWKNELKEGDEVLVPFQFGTRKTIDERDVVIYDDPDILAIVEK